MKAMYRIFAVLMIAAFVLSACGGGAATTAPTEAPAATQAPVETEAPAATEAPAPTEAPAATEAPTEEPTVEPTEAPAAVTCAEPVKVGLITDASGALASYGEMILRSFMLGMEYATGAEGSVGPVFALDNKQNNFMVGECEIQVIVVDDQGNPETTATVARELIDVQEVDVMVGTVSSAATATLQGIAMENQVPLIVAPAAANDITGVNFNEYTFRTSRNNYMDAMNVCQFLAKDYKNLVQIAPDNIFGTGSAFAFRDACTTAGATFVVDDILAPLDTSDFTPYMEQILDSGADAWIVTWAGGGFVPMFQAAKDLGVMDEMQMGTAYINNALMPAVFANAIGRSSGILYHYTAPTNPINDWLVAETKTRYGVPPDLFDADGANAAIMLVEALKVTGGDTSAEALVAAMEGLEFEGPKGTIFIRPEDHVAIQDMYIVKLINLDDPEFKFYELVETTRPEPPCLLPEALKDRCGDLPYGSLSGQ